MFPLPFAESGVRHGQILIMFKKLLPASFRFSWSITLTAFVLMIVMITCSFWQWSRYKEKLALLETFSENDRSAPLPFPLDGDDDRLLSLENRKVSLTGRFDYAHEIIIENRSYISSRPGGHTGPGYHLLTPFLVEGFLIEGQQAAVLVSRGFIPFESRSPESWEQYRGPNNEIVTIEAVLKEAPRERTFGPKHTAGPPEKPLRRWYFADTSKIQQQLPYPLVLPVYAQQLRGQVLGEFPAEQISLEVPPSTHFGYTIEWALLAVAVLVISFLLQAFPRRRRGFSESMGRPDPTEGQGMGLQDLGSRD